MVEQGEHDITIHLSIERAQRAQRAAAPMSSTCTVRSRPLTSALALALAARRQGDGEAGGLELSAAAAPLLLARALPA
ncbi:hypothetical protein [Sorangium sp. So ce233]|uniref:hypothetical protein n=1 Tax=Sorangium sp. So ce233 TaxID=3133290 RepID=UPI003F5DB8BF